MKRILLPNLPILIVELLTLLVMGYIGYGEVNRKYPEFVQQRMQVQGEILRNSLESYLQAGLSLEQFSGFNAISGALLRADEHIQRIIVSDPQGRVVFHRQRSDMRDESMESRWVEQDLRSEDLPREDFFTQLTPVKGKFGPAGTVEIFTERGVVAAIVKRAFEPVLVWGAVIFAVFAAVLLMISRICDRGRITAARRNRWINIAYAASFAAMAGVLAVAVFGAYEHGARAKTRALGDSLAQRMIAILDLGIHLEDISGINDVLVEYKERNPDVNSMALTKNGISLYHTDPQLVGRDYQSAADSVEYRVDLDADTQHQFFVAVSIPVSVVLRAVFDSANAFIILFVACALMSWVFLGGGNGLLTILQRRVSAAPHREEDNYKLGLQLIKPGYFLVVFVSALSLPFLPQAVQEMAHGSDSIIASASTPFTIYYAAFALVLVPAGHLARGSRLKPLMAAGFLFEAMGSLLVAVTGDLVTLTVGRALSGAGQGIFLIGLQSYILAITPAAKRTQGAAVKVNGRNAGLISGTAVGGLLFTYLNLEGVFLVGAALSLMGILYLLTLLPDVREVSAAQIDAVEAQSKRSMIKDILAVLRDGEFMRTLALIGLIGKMAVTGVIMFAIPLLLGQRGFASEQTAQVLMLYYISSIIVTHFASRHVDRLGTTRLVLVASALIAGLGMLMIGMIGVTHVPAGARLIGVESLGALAVQLNQMLAATGIEDINLYILLLAMLFCGASNGLMAAPVITHVNNTEVAQRIGLSATTASYVFLERGGHVIGPAVINSMLILSGNSALAIAVFGVQTILFGVLFLLAASRAPSAADDVLPGRTSSP